MRTYGILVLAGAALLLHGTRPASAVDVTACEQTVAAGTIGVLQADLDCELNGVLLEAGATLSLNGHALRGGSNIGVYCGKGRCTIEGPGEIADGPWIAVFLEDRVHLTVRNVTLRANDVGILGSYAGRTKVTATDVVLDDHQQWALSTRSLKAVNLSVRGNAGPLFVVSAATGRIDGGEISDNGGLALTGGRLRLDGVSVTGNVGPGVRASRTLRLVDSTVTGNGTGGSGIDLLSERRPKLTNSTCGRSEGPTGAPWGVCAND